MKLPNINLDLKPLTQIAEEFNIKEMYLFGSILTDSFSQSSDIDVLITYKDRPIGLLQLFELKEKIMKAYQEMLIL